MPRPATLPVWATNANYTGGPAVGTPSCVAPSAAKQAEGWDPADKPGAQNQNWWQNLVYQWWNWLAAGILDGTWEFTGAVTMDTTLGVTGAATLASTLGVTGAITGSAAITGASLHFTADAQHTLSTLLSTDNLAGAPGAHHIRAGGRWQTNNNSNPIYYDLTPWLRGGDVITGISIPMSKNTTNAITNQFQVVHYTNADGLEHGPDASFSDSSNSPGSILLDFGTLALSVVATDTYYLKIIPGTSATADFFSAPYLHFHRP